MRNFEEMYTIFELPINQLWYYIVDQVVYGPFKTNDLACHAATQEYDEYVIAEAEGTSMWNLRDLGEYYFELLGLLRDLEVRLELIKSFNNSHQYKWLKDYVVLDLDYFENFLKNLKQPIEFYNHIVDMSGY